MKGLFILLAVVSVAGGLLISIMSFLANDTSLLVSSIINFANGFAWYLVGEMWETQNYLNSEIYKLKKQNQ